VLELTHEALGMSTEPKTLHFDALIPSLQEGVQASVEGARLQVIDLGVQVPPETLASIGEHQRLCRCSKPTPTPARSSAN
jgi:hypothetical protein